MNRVRSNTPKTQTSQENRLTIDTFGSDDIFEIERLDRGEYLLKRRTGTRKSGSRKTVAFLSRERKNGQSFRLKLLPKWCWRNPKDT